MIDATQDQPRDELSEFAELISSGPDSSRRDDVDPSVRRARVRRRLIVSAVIIAVLLAATGGYVGWALNAPLDPPAIATKSLPVPTTPAAAVTLPAEGDAAISVSGADDYLGAAASGIWAQSGTAEPRPIASISKLITALVVLDAKPLASAVDPGPTITFDKADHDLYDKYYVLGATIAPMPTGTTMSLHDALATMLIPSASNYAEAVSSWAFGSQSAFLRAARNWLTAHGLTGTTITEPTGISPRNTSTPADLIAIGKLAAADPTVAQIAATRTVFVPGPGSMSNTNDIVGTDGINGLKTGNLGDGNYNLLYTARLDVGHISPLTVTGVVLGGSSRDSVAHSVLVTLDGIRAGFHDVSVAKYGQEVGTISTPWGSSAKLIVGENASIFTWSDAPISMTMDTTTPTTYDDGENVGTLTWTAGVNTVTAVVKIEGGITPPTEWWRLTHPGDLGSP